jgi:chaperonin GroEL (HSP60 family)
MNPMDLKRGIDIAVTAVVKDTDRQSKKVGSSEEIAQIDLAPGPTNSSLPVRKNRRK